MNQKTKDILNFSGITIMFFLVINWYVVLFIALYNGLTLGQYATAITFDLFGEQWIETVMYILIMIPMGFAFINNLTNFASLNKRPRTNKTVLTGQTALWTTIYMITVIGIVLIILAILN